MGLFTKKYNVNYTDLITQLEAGDEENTPDMLWQPKGKKIDYSPISVGLIQKLKKENQAEPGLKIHSTYQKGGFELIIFDFPKNADFPFTPVIIDKSNSKIAGILLPFNELHGHLSKKESKEINAVGMIWVQFAMKNKFNK
jgi:hypothetical protein